MEYIYAALLLDAAGKEITEQNLLSIVKAAGLSPDEAKAKAIVSSLQSVNIKDVIKNAQNVQSVAAPAAKEEKKEENKEDEKKSEEEAASGLASLFG